MSLLRNIASGLRSLVRKEQVEQESDEELRGFLEMAVEEKVKQGMGRRDAARAVRLERGGLEATKEMVRGAGWESFAEAWWQDLRFAVRLLRKSPGFALVAALTLGLGIGANTAIFGVVNAVLLRPLAMQDPGRVGYLQEQWRDIFPGFSVGNFGDVRQKNNSFTEVCASHNGGFNLETADVPERVDGEYVTANYFATFGVQPIAGRVFTSEEDQPGHARVALISERLWRTRFGGNPAILEARVRINGVATPVVGVMPKSFDPLLSRTDLWIPAALTPAEFADYDNHYLNVMARLRPGVTFVQAQSELSVIARRLAVDHPIDNKDRGLRVQSLTSALLGDQRLSLRMILAAVGFLLLIVCANIANLQLVRAGTRQKEIALRAALGASRGRIVRQLLSENLVLGLVSGAAGVLFAYWALAWIVAHGPAEMPRLDQSRIDGGTLMFATGVALLSSFLFGLAPAMRSGSARLNEIFKSASGTVVGSRDGLRSFLVVAEVALAVLLMACAGLLIRSALFVSHVDPGFDTSNIIIGRIGLAGPDYRDPSVGRQTFERMVVAAGALPGVASAAVVSRAPLAGLGSSNGLLAEGVPFDFSNLIDARLQIVTPSYLSTARLQLKLGRDFTPQDTRDRTLVTIINETLARRMWPGQNPIGKRFACCEPGPKGRMDPVWHEVVGVVADVRAWGLDHDVKPEFYIPFAQIPPSAWDWIGHTMDLEVRTRGSAAPVRELQSMVASIAPAVPIYQLSSMQQRISGTLERSHFDTYLLVLFAGSALLLSSIGIYGVLSYMVAQRTRDIGIRMALGASKTRIVKDVLTFGMSLAGIGLVLGVLGAFGATRLLASLLYGVRPTDVITFLMVSVLLLVVALFASYLPARRAMRIDPMTALRYE